MAQIDSLRLLSGGDIGDAMKLSSPAGWNQTECDWERLLELQPDGCWCIERDRTVVATATLVMWGDLLGWIGMVLTSMEHRGKGMARRLMEHLVRLAQTRSIARIGLDATSLGIHLYRKLGFVEECSIERWERPANLQSPPCDLGPWQPGAAMDLEAFGADRMRLLAALSRGEAASIRGSGYAMGRPGTRAAYCGPLVARSNDAAELLLHWFLARHGGEPVFIDLFPQNSNAVGLARKNGFRPVRELTRMSLALRADAPALAGDNSRVFAIAGFEYG